jgi:YD repeat-containing protein
MDLVWSTSYNDLERTVTSRDPLGRTSQVRLDMQGQVVSRRTPMGVGREALSGTSPEIRDSAVYNNFGQLVWSQSPGGDSTRMRWDIGGWVHWRERGEGLTERMSLDWHGLPHWVVREGRGGSRDSTWSQFDGMGRLVVSGVDDHPSSVRRFWWDSYGGTVDPGQLLASTQGSASGGSGTERLAMEYSYNPLGSMVRRVHRTSLPGGGVLRDTLQYRYRADQLLESELLPRGAVVHVSYDPFDRVGKQWILDPAGNRHVVLDTVLYGRDGSVDSVSMGSRLGQRIGYDSIFGLVDRVGMFKGGSPLSPLEWQRRYNQAMELSQEVRPGGEKAQFDWDNLGRLTGVRYPSGVSTGKPNLQYGWNEDGVRTSMVHDYGRSDWTLPDGSMQPTRVTSTHEGVVNQAWDWRGNLTRTGRYASAADASAGEAAWSSVYGSGTTSDSLWLQRRDFRYNSDDGLERAILMRGADGGRRDTSILGYVLDGSGLMVGSL